MTFDPPPPKVYTITHRTCPVVNYEAPYGRQRERRKNQWAVWEQGSLGQYVTPWYDAPQDAERRRDAFEREERRRVPVSAQEREGFDDTGACSVWYDQAEGAEWCGILGPEEDLPVEGQEYLAQEPGACAVGP